MITSLSWIFIPKFTLVEIPGYTQGVRVEDLLFLMSIFFRSLNLSNPKNLFEFSIIGGRQGFVLITYLLVFEIFSIYILGSNLTILIFGLRWFEYFLMGALIIESASIYRNFFVDFIKFYIIFNLIYSIALFLFGGFSSRYSGITEGPWEITSVLIFLYLGVRQFLSYNQKHNYLIFVLVICFFSQARIQIISLIFVYFYFYKISKKQVYLILSIIIIFSFFGFDEVIKALRFSDFNFESYSNIWDIIFDKGRDISWDEVSRIDGVDKSSLSRIIIWLSFIYPWIDSGFYGFLFGIGGGFGGVVVDGFYIRLLTEFGLIGSTLFYFWYKSVLKGTPYNFQWAILIVSMVIAISNDPITSQRIFSSFALAVGLSKFSSNCRIKIIPK